MRILTGLECEHACIGNGNGEKSVGCGERLFIEEGDLHNTTVGKVNLIWFRCPVCGVETDIVKYFGCGVGARATWTRHTSFKNERRQLNIGGQGQYE